MSIEGFRHVADLVLRYFDPRQLDPRKGAERFTIHVDHVYSGDPVARAWQWTSAGDDAERRACSQAMVTLRVVADRDWHVLDFAAPELLHRRPQAGATSLGRALGEWHIIAIHAARDRQTVEGGFMLFEQAADFEAARDELRRPVAA